MEYQEGLDISYEALKHLNVHNQHPQFLDIVHCVWSKLEEKGLADSSPEYKFGPVQNVVRRIFWHFFRSDIITLGNSSGSNFPWFEVTDYGIAVIEGKEYLTNDVITYLKRVKTEIPNVDSNTEIYLKEAIRCFNDEHYIAAAMMIGVACENEFLLLLDDALLSKHKTKFKKVEESKWLTKKIENFSKSVSALKGDIDTYNSDVNIDLDIQLGAILVMIKNSRNDAGHPTGRIYTRDEIFTLLSLVIPCLKKMHQLKEFFKSAIS